MVTIITDSPMSFRKIGEQISIVFRSVETDNIISDVTIYIGTMLMFNHRIMLARRLICYVDVPRISQIFRKVWDSIKHKAVLITNSKYCADLIERYYGIHVADIVPHAVDPRYYNEKLMNNYKLFHIFNMSQTYREGVDIYSQVIAYLKQLKKNVTTLHVARGNIIGADYTLELKQYLPDWLFAQLYAMSHSYLVTSRHEGFCMHIVEAGAVGCIPIVPNTEPYIEHKVPFKVTFNATLDIDKLWSNPDGQYPVVEFNIDDVVKAIETALKQEVKQYEVEYVRDQYDMYRIYARLIEYVLKR